MSFVVGGVLVGIGLFSISAPAQAYTAQAIRFSSTETLLVTTYNATLLNRDGIIPISAMVDTKGTHEPLVAGYKIVDRDDKNFTGQIHGGFILSSQPIANGGYALKEKEKTTIMLVSLISHEASAGNYVKALLTSVPMLVTKDGKTYSEATQTY